MYKKDYNRKKDKKVQKSDWEFAGCEGPTAVQFFNSKGGTICESYG